MAEQHLQLIDQILPRVTRQEVEVAVQDLRTELLRYPALPMIGNLICAAASTYVKSGDYTMPFAEHAGLVYWHEAAQPPAIATVTGAVVHEMFERIRSVFSKVEGYYSTEERRATVAHDRAEIIHRLRLSGLRMRVPAYQVHQKRVLRGLFGPYAAQIMRECGFDIDDVIACFASACAMRLKDVAQFRNDGRPIRNQEHMDRHFATVGDYFTFTADRLAEESGRALANVERVIDAFCVKRGEADQHALFPSPFSILRQKPILAIGDGRHIVPNLDLLFPSAQGRIEDLINPAVTLAASKGFWPTYESYRGKWVEREADRILDKLMPGGVGMIGAYYQSNGARVEGDVVRKVDDVVFVLEGKAGSFTPAALRGGTGSLDTSVADIITKGHDQSTRTESYIAQGGRTFDDEHDATVLTLSGKIREIVRIVVTLDSVGALGTAAAALQRHGYMAGEPTWVLSLTDLMIIADTLVLPGQFRQYVRMRYNSLTDERILTFDEMDLLGMYITHNDLWPVDEQDIATLVPTGYTDALDDYYVRHKSTAVPHQDVPRELQDLIRALARRSDANWSHAVCDVLALGHDSRQQMAETIRDLTVTAAKRQTDFTVSGGDGAWAITVVLHANADPADVKDVFVLGISHGGGPQIKKRLIIGYDPARGEASAEYYEKVNDRYFRVPPALLWKSSLVKN